MTFILVNKNTQCKDALYMNPKYGIGIKSRNQNENIVWLFIKSKNRNPMSLFPSESEIVGNFGFYESVTIKGSV